MLEKLRIYNGEKKSKPRIEAEKQWVVISFSAIASLYSTRLPEGSPRSSRLNARYPGGYVRDDPKKRHITMPAGGPAPPNARGPKPRCPTQPGISLNALKPEAQAPRTMPSQTPQHDGLPKLADQPPLPSAGPAPSRLFAVPAMAYPPSHRPASPPAYPPAPPGPGPYQHTRLQHQHLLLSSPSRPRRPSPHSPCRWLPLQTPFSLLLCSTRHHTNTSVHCVRLPNGHRRQDPKTVTMICGPGLPMPSVAELSNEGR